MTREQALREVGSLFWLAGYTEDEIVTTIPADRSYFTLVLSGHRESAQHYDRALPEIIQFNRRSK